MYMYTYVYKYIYYPNRMQCEKLLGLAGGSTKKCGNKKSGETPIRYNVIHMYIFLGIFR